MRCQVAVLFQSASTLHQVAHCRLWAGTAAGAHCRLGAGTAAGAACLTAHPLGHRPTRWQRAPALAVPCSSCCCRALLHCSWVRLVCSVMHSIMACMVLEEATSVTHWGRLASKHACMQQMLQYRWTGCFVCGTRVLQTVFIFIIIPPVPQYVWCGVLCRVLPDCVPGGGGGCAVLLGT